MELLNKYPIYAENGIKKLKEAADYLQIDDLIKLIRVRVLWEYWPPRECDFLDYL